MRSAIVAAFAAGALAVPLVERGIVYETQIEYATAFVTVTEGAAAPTTAEAAAATTTSVKKYGNHWGHKKPKTSKSVESPQENNQPAGYTSYWATTWTESAPAATSQAEQQQEAPAYSSKEEEAAPAPTSQEAPQSYTSSEAAPSSAPASSASGAKPTDYQGIVLHHHNIHRANHSVSDLTWSDALAATAQKIGESCNYAHDTETDVDSVGPYGQNIAAGVKADNVSAVITELFYNGEVALYGDQYGQKDINMDAFHEWGHFTQIVWSNTTEVGCATVDCSAKGLGNTGGNVSPYFTVCNYAKQGNMVMDWEFSYNVKAPRGDKTCYWNDAL